MKKEAVFTRSDMRRALDAAISALWPERDSGEPAITLTLQQAKRCYSAIVSEHGAHGGDHACYRCFSDVPRGGFVCVKHQLEDFIASCGS